MRVVFFGTPDFAVPSLTALLDANVDVAAVVTQPDRPAARSHSQTVAPPVKRAAVAAGIPVWQPDPPESETFYQQLHDLHADIGVVVAYGRLLRPELLKIPRHGLVNIHASLLPRWRGAAPIQWALLSGDDDTGVAIMRVDAGLDTGAVWQEARLAITSADTAGTLANRLSHLGALTLVHALPRIAAGQEPTRQVDVGITLAPKIRRDDARIRWHQSASAISCRIRAMDPAPGAWTTIGGVDLKLFGPIVVAAAGTDRSAPVERSDAARRAAPAGPPGTVIRGEEQLMIATEDGAIAIAEVQPSGRRRISAAEWLRGVHQAAGARFL
ncbi:MAG: methionyl-tRNA formyltransferase [Gemmatimonadales bacterium]